MLGTAAIGTATIAFWMRDDLTPWNLEATFTVSYNTMSDSKFNIKITRISFEILTLDVCHTIQKTYKLPLKLVARAFQQPPSAATAGQCKITLGANKPVVDLNTLFPGKTIFVTKIAKQFSLFIRTFEWR
jgi:hypothetical protein